ncbi:O-antigen polymerase [Polaribacter sp. MED152]|uniref:O-antigen polymerase n=1 Tax=Polaribacter sp. MED152 TaxID=313598 RepID=UPI001EE75C08|nr:O-antigen polymerase [Polaribacter sp. MED152]
MFLILFIISTLILGFLINKIPDIDSLTDVSILFFSALILIFLIHGFKNYGNLKTIIPYGNYNSFNKLTKVLILVGLFVTLINIFITFKAFGALLSESVNVQSYKNEGEAGDFLIQWVGAVPLFISRLLSPIGYYALGLHFYFLIIRNVKKSFIFFIISLNIPLLGFHGLSRSAAIQFILMYIAFFLYSYSALGKKIRRKMLVYTAVIFTTSFLLLNIISESRFSKYYYIPSSSPIQDPVLYSTLDYGSQWNLNGFEVLKNYSVDKLMYGRSTFPIISFLGNRIGLSFTSLADLRYKNLGDKYDGTFNGVVATLLYDFGYFFTLIFAVIFYKIVAKRGPKKGMVKLHHFVSFGVLIPLPLMFFTNNAYSYIALNLAIIYLIIINFLMKISKN